ncbi:hypothetical protein BDN70DRAFT_931212 [Pholiota conissans]|uniref:Uncharacterized protein n=1 Tax=Pholiota conissans TaxID=109636 RepID=A0A9P5Z464_9AGAR|nr:hypothetical protein BDN70DRAFT_931212 [Pholiota conissans]
MSLTEIAIIIASKNAMDITVQPTLTHPIESLSDSIHKASRGFYDIHSLLMRRKSTKALEQLKTSKVMFISEFQTIHQVLQGSYRHIIDFTSSCRRAPDERAVTAQRCQRSGKAILRDLQDVTRTFEAMLEGFEGQRAVLSGISLSASKQSAIKGLTSANGEIPVHYPPHEDSVEILYEALESIQSSLKDLFVFWDGHVSFLNLVLNRQTNFPAPGEETQATVQTWTEYQRVILKANSSISQSIETMNMEPVVISIETSRRMPWRRHTYPQTKLRREPTIIETLPKPAAPWQEPSKRSESRRMSILSGRLTSFVKGLF